MNKLLCAVVGAVSLCALAVPVQAAAPEGATVQTVQYYSHYHPHRFYRHRFYRHHYYHRPVFHRHYGPGFYRGPFRHY